ncbi:MAG TPA: ABC transporter ATP-binding protein [Aliidongia sp.]|nr:ABC transporter ATP-binding protein [Aliidongia sp.]HEV2678141.1 ABC transporter ATP-binding protein [Aliidongia sp.]
MLSSAAVATAPGLPEFALQLDGLSKTYAPRGKFGAVTALDRIDLKVPRGAMFGLLGPNGAGKSTMINILAGLVVKTGGSARIWTHDVDQEPRQSRAAIGVVPQELNIDPFFTPFELLDLQAGLYGVPKRERRTMEILAAVGLADKAKAYARTLSGGMRRRLMVAKAMVHSPPILVLDEPTAGVDVELRQTLWAYIRELNRGGTTILLTTHYLEEAQELCDRIAIIDHGRLVAHDSTEALLRRLDAKEIILSLSADPEPLPDRLRVLGFERSAPSRLRLRYQPSCTQLGPLLAAVGEAGYGILDVSTEETNLQDIFLQLTGSQADQRAGVGGR